MIHPDVIFGRLGNRLFQLAYIYGQTRRGAIPDWYVQDPVYFEAYRSELKALFVPDKKPLNKVAIHVRRAGNPINKAEPNYSDNPFMVNLSETSYYKDAMALFPGESFIVFSDDIAWCKEQELFQGCEFSEGSELDDLGTMASCKGVIAANSSYSWWGGFLSDGTVVAPKAWYQDKQERTKCPNSWIRI